MGAERTLLSCPGRIEDWLGAAADQIETLLQAPMPSLSGSDQAIGALRIKRDPPSWTTSPYDSQPMDLVPGTSPVTHQVPPSVSSDRVLCMEKSPSRCENCVAEERSRCSRDLPSCTRCHTNGLFSFYVEGVPTGRRKPQGRTRVRSRIVEGEPDLPLESFLFAPASEVPALPNTDEALATQYHRPDTHPLYAASEYPLPSSENYPTILPVDCPTDTPSTRNSTNSKFQTAATKQIITLPATPTFSTGKLETAREIASVELSSQWPGAVSDESDLGIVLAAAVESLCQKPGSEEERKALENVLRKCIDCGTQEHASYLVALPLESQTLPHRRTSAMSSPATTPFASTLVSRSTSQSSGTDSLPITPATELPTLLNGADVQQTSDANVSTPQISSTSRRTSFAFRTAPSTMVMETRLLHTEEVIDLHLLSPHRYQTSYDVTSGAGTQVELFSDRFVEELFEEGDAAKRLLELQRDSPRKKKV